MPEYQVVVVEELPQLYDGFFGGAPGGVYEPPEWTA